MNINDKWLRASSFEPGKTGRLGSVGFRDLASPLFTSKNFDGQVSEISVTGTKIFTYEHSNPGNRDESL